MMESSDWKRPDQVMKLHRFKLRKNALQARIKGTHINDDSPKSSLKHAPLPSLKLGEPLKRKNPFSKNEQNKKFKEEKCEKRSIKSDFEDISINDNSTFELLKAVSSSDSFKLEEILQTSSPSILIATNNLQKESSVTKAAEGKPYIPIDWSIRSKIRIMSPKPFAFKGKLKTSEEASGITGFVRCMDIGDKQITLDTSPNARFHQCCLVWQHPSIAWLELFPRSVSKANAHLANITLNQNARNALYVEWCSSFRSLFQLLRVGQCPYFYVIGNSFTALFRAAGICGISEVHALLTPTTKGFRDSMKQEDIQFTMPLKKPETIDNLSSINVEENSDELENDDEEHSENWFKSRGIEEAELNKINNSQSRIIFKRESEKDSSRESLVFVSGVETQALFNFLMNCKTLTTITGPLAHIPPTLLSPVAFHGATLKPLKVRENVVIDKKEKYYSMELLGPILPAVIPSLCSFMVSSQLEKFSISCAYVQNTIAFSLAKHGKETKDTKEPNTVFGLENLTDCGLNKEILNHLCNRDPDRIQHFESLTFSNSLYNWE